MTVRRKIEINPLNSLSSILVFILVLFVLFFIARSIFQILYFVAPILLIATLVINHKVVLSYGKWIINLFKTNPLYGLGAGLFTFLAFPVVCGYLFLKALFLKKVGQLQEQATAYQQQQQGDFADYEVLDEKPLSLDVPEIEKRAEVKPDTENQYEDLFGDN